MNVYVRYAAPETAPHRKPAQICLSLLYSRCSVQTASQAGRQSAQPAKLATYVCVVLVRSYERTSLQKLKIVTKWKVEFYLEPKYVHNFIYRSEIRALIIYVYAISKTGH